MDRTRRKASLQSSRPTVQSWGFAVSKEARRGTGTAAEGPCLPHWPGGDPARMFPLVLSSAPRGGMCLRPPGPGRGLLRGGAGLRRGRRAGSFFFRRRRLAGVEAWRQGPRAWVGRPGGLRLRVLLAAAPHRLPDEAVVDGQDDGGQRDGEDVGQHGGQAHPLLVGLGRHARLLVPSVGGRLAPLPARPRLLLLHGGAAFGPMLHRPLRLARAPEGDGAPGTRAPPLTSRRAPREEGGGGGAGSRAAAAARRAEKAEGTPVAVAGQPASRPGAIGGAPHPLFRLFFRGSRTSGGFTTRNARQGGEKGRAGQGRRVGIKGATQSDLTAQEAGGEEKPPCLKKAMETRERTPAAESPGPGTAPSISGLCMAGEGGGRGPYSLPRDL